MSHIPSSAMPHAGPTHHDEPAAAPALKKDAAAALSSLGANWPIAAIAFGGVLALGAVAVAVPLLRTSAKPKPKARAKPGAKRKAHG